VEEAGEEKGGAKGETRDASARTRETKWRRRRKDNTIEEKRK
jgi:hypothetical protein